MPSAPPKAPKPGGDIFGDALVALLVDEKSDAQFAAMEKTPHFFQHLVIATDGGFSELAELWYALRVPFALSLVILMVMNLQSVLSTSWATMTIAESTDGANKVTKYCITKYLVNRIFPGTPIIHYDPLFFLALFEVGAIVYLGIRLLIFGYLIYIGKSDYSRWISVSSICWNVVPILSSFSSMKMLNYVTPTIFTQRINRFMESCNQAQEDGASPGSIILRVAGFILGHLLLGIFGFDAFMIKFEAAASMLNQGLPMPDVLLSSFLFLNQVLGVLDLDMFTKERLFLFIFGGEDARISPNEKRVQQVWSAMLCQRLWRCYAGRPDKFLFVILTFSDIDFQKLTLNEKAGKSM